MKKRSFVSNISMLTIIAFITVFILGPTTTGCGGSGGAANSGEDSTTDFAAVTKTTSDSNGSVTFTATKLTGVNSVEINLTAPNGEAASGMNVYFTEAEDGYVMLVIRDPNGQYQTTFITFDVDDLSASSSSVIPSLYLENREVGATGIEFGDKSITIMTLVAVAGVSLVSSILLTNQYNKFKDVAGSIDPYRLANGDPECFSFGTLLDHFEIAAETAGLIFWTASTLATAGATTTTAGVYELILTEMTSAIKDELEDAFWDEVASIALAGAMAAGIAVDKTTDICWILRLPGVSDTEKFDYSKILEMRVDMPCATAADCEEMTETTAIDLTILDIDGDGYSASNDCDDLNKFVYPGAFDICDDNLLQNCSATVEPSCNVTVTAFLRDFITEGWPELDDGGSGDVSVVRVGGSFQGDNLEITEARIILNDFNEQLLPITFGSWFTYVNLASGLNRIQVVGQSGSYHAARTLTFNNTGTQDDLAVMLSWDECPDLDLYVLEPGGTTVSVNNTTGQDGSLALDCSSGWGPEIYTAESASTGTYTFYAKHAGDGGACGAENVGTNYTIRVMTPYGTKIHTGSLSTNGEQSSSYSITF
jgi:hypothetical protein